MKILIVGGGGREHALAWRLKQSPSVKQIYASPGNPGIAQVATCLAAPGGNAGYAELAQANGADLTIVGPEAPLVDGIVDEFHRRNLHIIGPTQAAAQLEGSKIFAKRFFERAGIPTARSILSNTYEQALSSIKHFHYPVVVKADGLRAGKGVIIANHADEAIDAIQKLGPGLVIEEFLQGEEVSFIGLSNGRFLLPFTPTQDHKRVFDGDTGPNTGGMGAYTDPRILTVAQTGDIMDRIIMPTLWRMQADEMPFTGFLYAGLMMTEDGPKLLEYNVRLGDPETQAIMHGFPGDFAQLLALMAAGTDMLEWPEPAGCSVCVTLAAENYPATPVTGDEIQGIEAAEASGATVFQAGTKMAGGKLATAGGRVLGVTAGGDTLSSAITKAYAAVDKISFRGMHYRRDIGHKGLPRW